VIPTFGSNIIPSPIAAASVATAITVATVATAVTDVCHGSDGLGRKHRVALGHQGRARRSATCGHLAWHGQRDERVHVRRVESPV